MAAILRATVDEAYLRLRREKVIREVVIGQLVPRLDLRKHLGRRARGADFPVIRCSPAAFASALSGEEVQELRQIIPVREDRIDREPSFSLQHLQETLDILLHRFLRPQPRRRRHLRLLDLSC